MKHFSRSLYPAAIIAICINAASAARADDAEDRDNAPNRYLAATLTSDIPGVAPNTAPVLQNAWGVAFSPAASPFWISDNATGCSTLYKIPWGVDSNQFWGQTEVAYPLNLEATNAARSPLRGTDRYPNQSWRNFRLIGTQPFNLADHVAVAGRRREDVEAQRLGWGHRCAAVALFGAQAEGVRADGAILPDHRHSRGGTGWLLDSPGAAERR